MTPPSPSASENSGSAEAAQDLQSQQAPETSQPVEPPVAPRHPRRREHHSDVFVDEYEWLRDKTGAETVAYLDAENAYTARQTAHLADLRESIFGEIRARTQETDLSVPSRTGSFWYYRRTIEGSQYPVLCRTAAQADDWTPPTLDPDVAVPGEEVLVDCNALAEGREYFSLGTFAVTLDDIVLAYSTDVVGDERFTIYLKDLRTGELLPDEIPNTMAGATWSADGSHLFYSTVDDSWRPDRIWRHSRGTEPSDDVLVHHETDERFWTSIGRTTSDRFLLIASGSSITSEYLILDADRPTGEFRVVVPRTTGVEYKVEHAVVAGSDRLVVLHNRDAVNFTLGIGPMSLTSLDDLEALLPPRDDVRLVDVEASSTALVVNLRLEGLPQVQVFGLTGDGIGPGSPIEFDEPLFAATATGFSDWKQPLVRLSYSSWVTPSTVYEYDPVTGDLHLRKQQPVLGGYDPSDYIQTREWVTARDGAQIPISVVRHKDVEPKAGGPLLLYGYGAYEISMDPGMSIARLSLLDRGIVYVVAHIRGGGEMGRLWYERGKLLEKKNTFTDYVDCAQYLVDTGWTGREHLVGLGGSAGGLLMGAVANLAPDLFAAIVAQVPFVDALTSILDPSLPLTVIEWDEWGDPLHDPEVYAYVKSYSPYENVGARPYPAIYAITSINDTRVLYVEPAKWVARLRATVPGDSVILLKCEMSAGHGGASGRYDAWRETADYYAWIVERSGGSVDPFTTAQAGVRSS